VIAAAVPLDVAHRYLRESGKRRLAMIDDDGKLIGLLRLKRSGNDFCSDENVQERANDPH
jgi:hypothetical protein